MKTLYIECAMGAAGDMLTAALLELQPNREEFISKINQIGMPGVVVTDEPSAKCGIFGTHVSVIVGGEEEETHDHHHGEHGHEHEHKHGHAHHEHAHSGMHEIEHIISHLKISDKVRQDVLAVYNLIAEAESHAHKKPVDEIHFHEVGAMDAIADIVGVCMLIEELAPEKIFASPVHVGSGHVHCAHGILPVPAPATAFILAGVPSYGGSISGELCTPTGAALIKHFASDFGPMPVMKTEKIGYGMGKKDFKTANCVRVFIGESGTDDHDEVLELSANLDDMTPEALSFACDRLFEAGSLDVFTQAIGMKKSRTGVLLTCICHLTEHESVVSAMFKHTSTIGIREKTCARYILKRELGAVDTQYGKINIKTSSGWGVKKSKPEHEDIARIAKENNISITDVIKSI